MPKPTKSVGPIQLGFFDQDSTGQRLTEIRTGLGRITYYIAVFDLFAAGDDENAHLFKAFKQALQRKARRSLEGDQKAVLRAVHEGFASVKDISLHTHIPENTVYVQLKKLLSARLVVRTCVPPTPGKGGDKKTFLYWPVE